MQEKETEDIDENEQEDEVYEKKSKEKKKSKVHKKKSLSKKKKSKSKGRSKGHKRSAKKAKSSSLSFTDKKKKRKSSGRSVTKSVCPITQDESECLAKWKHCRFVKDPKGPQSSYCRQRGPCSFQEKDNCAKLKKCGWVVGEKTEYCTEKK
jgi:hypothetical protein